MSEKQILQGNCEHCGPSQSGPEPLPSPGSIRPVSQELLVLRPETKRSETAPELERIQRDQFTRGPSALIEPILPSAEQGAPIPQLGTSKNQMVKDLVDAGIPYVAVFHMGEGNLRMVPGNDIDGVMVAGLLHHAIKQC